MRILKMLFLLSLFLSFSCGLNDPKEEPPLVGTEWRLLSRSLPDQSVAGGGSEYFLIFEENGMINGQASCNGCGGDYSLAAGDSIDLLIACTEIACQDGWIATPFPSGKASYRINGRILKVNAVDGSKFYFVAAYQIPL